MVKFISAAIILVALFTLVNCGSKNKGGNAAAVASSSSSEAPIVPVSDAKAQKWLDTFDKFMTDYSETSWSVGTNRTLVPKMNKLAKQLSVYTHQYEKYMAPLNEQDKNMFLRAYLKSLNKPSQPH